jgi:hypothetical protein
VRARAINDRSTRALVYKGVDVAQLCIIQRMHADRCHAALIEFLQQCPQVLN